MELERYSKNMTKEEIEKLKSSPEIEDEIEKIIEIIKKGLEENNDKKKR